MFHEEGTLVANDWNCIAELRLVDCPVPGGVGEGPGLQRGRGSKRVAKKLGVQGLKRPLYSRKL